MFIYEKALQAAGYTGEPTEQNVREMFTDYVHSGFFSNVEPEDIEDITTDEICDWFIRNP
jgi:hypothetical protein